MRNVAKTLTSSTNISSTVATKNKHLRSCSTLIGYDDHTVAVIADECGTRSEIGQDLNDETWRSAQNPFQYWFVLNEYMQHCRWGSSVRKSQKRQHIGIYRQMFWFNQLPGRYENGWPVDHDGIYHIYIYMYIYCCMTRRHDEDSRHLYNFETLSLRWIQCTSVWRFRVPIVSRISRCIFLWLCMTRNTRYVLGPLILETNWQPNFDLIQRSIDLASSYTRFCMYTSVYVMELEP